MKNIKKTALMGLLLAFCIVMTSLEHAIPPLPFLPPNVKFGLSNIAIMYCIFFIGKSNAFTLGLLRSVFVFIIRGPIASLLSFGGGVTSIFIIIVFDNIFKNKLSYISLSIVGAITHNIVQIAIYSVLSGTNVILYYTPVLIIAGVIMGILTGTILNILLPNIEKNLKY